MTGTRLDTGHPISSILLWPMLGKSQLQMDKECAPGNRGAAQGKEWPLPCPEPLCRVAAGAGGSLSALFSPHLGAAEQLQSVPPILVQSFEQLHREAKALGRGKQGLREAPPNHQQLGRGNPSWAQSACPPLALTRQGVRQVSSCLSFPPGMIHLGVLLLEHRDLASSLTAMKTSTHLSCPAIRFTGLEGEICPLPPSLAIPGHSQPVGAALGAACFTACGGKHSPLHPPRVAPSAGEAQQIPQGTSGPGKLCLLLTLCMPRCQGPGRLQHPSERCVQAWAGLGRAGGPFTQP